MSLFLEKWLPQWGDPQAYRVYRNKLDAVAECQRIFSQNKLREIVISPANVNNPSPHAPRRYRTLGSGSIGLRFGIYT